MSPADFLFEPGLNGLHAVAVLLVIQHHTGLFKVSGGHMDVSVSSFDSRFPLFRIGAGEMQQGCFCSTDFYKRRICLWPLPISHRSAGA